MQNNLFVHMCIFSHVGEVAVTEKYHFVQQAPLAQFQHARSLKKVQLFVFAELQQQTPPLTFEFQISFYK